MSHSDLITLDPAHVKVLWERVNEVFLVTAYPHFALKKRREWVTVPVPSSDHFDDFTVTRIAEAIQVARQSQFFALLIEPLINTPLGLAFPSSVNGLEQYNNSCALFSYMLFDSSLTWMIICTKEDYFLVVGEPTFVSTVVGTSLDEAYNQFLEFIQDMAELEYSQELLTRVLNTAAEEYLNVREGELVAF